MVQDKTHEELIEIWKCLPKYKYSKDSKGLLYGMLGVVAGSQYQPGIRTVICYACRNYFAGRLDAQTHPCQHEKEFREVAGRVIPVDGIRQIVTHPENIISIPPEQNIIEISPESWIRWNFELLQERDRLREYIDDLTGQIDILKYDKASLYEQINKMRTAILDNQQAKAYEDYNTR